jgi:hypothetical protein
VRTLPFSAFQLFSFSHYSPTKPLSVFRFQLFFFLRPRPLPAATLPADTTEFLLVDITAKLNALTPAQRAGLVKMLNT